MTTTEILSQIEKLSPAEKRQLLEMLDQELNQNQSDMDWREKEFAQNLLRRGIISEMPLRLPDDEFRQNFKPVEIKGEPLSETIIRERL
jgi:hypothetical protein